MTGACRTADPIERRGAWRCWRSTADKRKRAGRCDRRGLAGFFTAPPAECARSCCVAHGDHFFLGLDLTSLTDTSGPAGIAHSAALEFGLRGDQFGTPAGGRGAAGRG